MPPFSWTSDRQTAEREQLNLRELLMLQDSFSDVSELKKGLAIGTSYDENSKHCVAVGVPFNAAREASGNPSIASMEIDFPYVPGLLAYRVGPAVCALLDNMEMEPDIMVFDGQGIAHPRGLGLASHIGVLYNRPAVGVTRQNLYGHYVTPPSGVLESTVLSHPVQNVKLGYALVLNAGCDPCFISPGHLVSAESALLLVRSLAKPRKCFPALVDQAHALANRYARTNWRDSGNIT